MIPGLEPGSLFGDRYEVLRCIGTGGMGAVYLACDPDHRDFLVALKILYPGIIQSREARERFRTEIVASYRVNHQNVVRAFEYFDSEEMQAYAMEYIDGGDLAERMDGLTPERSMPEAQVIDTLHQIASGLSAIHEQGIVHRDLKPENILMTSDGVVKISDFGVARLRGSVTLTAVGAMVGTPKYVSPEYVESGECDHRGDIYAVGVIGYELAVGESPFRAESRLSVMMERFELDYSKLKNRISQYRPELLRIIAKAMSVDVSDRYQSAAQMRIDLDLLRREKEILYAREFPIDGTRVKQKDKTSVPGIDEITLLSGVVEQKAIPQIQAKPRKTLKWAIMAALTSFLLVVVGVALFSKHSPFGGNLGLNRLSQGNYSGAIKGLGSSDKLIGFQLWKTDKGVFALLGKSHCQIVPVSDEGNFNCGDLKYKLEIREAANEVVVGEVLDLEWNIKGYWKVRRGSV
ncbi:MAG: serine/threonine protein kinase [Deltaproteobacteria bacterium]|nr:serine/threonine protein kinase [Deltaproteobacteria bacterium]